MRTIWGIFISEEFLSFSRIEQLHHLLYAHVVHEEEDASISSILHNRRINISLVQHRSKFFSQQELFLGKSGQVLFFVVLLQSLIGMQNPSHPILTFILRAELLEFPDQCCLNSSQTLFDPGVRIVSVQRHNSDLNAVFTMQITGCNFLYGPNIGVPLNPSFWL